mgnify:CR=1 FL=1
MQPCLTIPSQQHAADFGAITHFRGDDEILGGCCAKVDDFIVGDFLDDGALLHIIDDDDQIAGGRGLVFDRLLSRGLSVFNDNGCLGDDLVFLYRLFGRLVLLDDYLFFDYNDLRQCACG